jgi:hypothetical protein
MWCDIWYDIIYDMIWYSMIWYGMVYDMIYDICLTEIGLTPGGGSTVHIYTQTIRRTVQSIQTIHRTKQFTINGWQIFKMYYHEMYSPTCLGSRESSSGRFMYKEILIVEM